MYLIFDISRPVPVVTSLHPPSTTRKCVLIDACPFQYVYILPLYYIQYVSKCWKCLHKIHALCVCVMCIHDTLGVSVNGGTPKWMVKIMENPINPWMIWGKHPLFRKHPHTLLLRYFCPQITVPRDGSWQDALESDDSEDVWEPSEE